jgi:acyl transferase domain-containing protein
MRHRDFLLVGTDQESGKATLFPEPDGTFANVPSEQLPFAFVFTGQGAQYAGMAKELIERCPPFRDTMQYLDRCLSRLGHGLAPCGWSLTETILAPPGISKVHHVTRSQPLCTAVQIGLVDLMKGWGISATAVVGHSSGEIAAAYAAGLLNAEQAILVAYYRGYALNQLRKKGAMIATGLDAAAAKALLSSELIDGVCIACVNSPGNVTLSGSVEGIETLYNRLQSAGTFVRKLHTDGRAYHSHMMKEVGPNYHKLLESVFQGVDLKTEATAKMFSSVGRSSHSSLPLEREARTAEYWRNNLEQSVQFVSAFTNMMAEHEFHVIEIGPHSALKGPINQIRSQQETLSGPYTPSLIRGQDSDICMKALAGALFRYGHMLRWDVVNATPPSLGIERLHDLPPYPWDYESSGLLWKEERASFDLRHRQYIRHELLGSRQLAGNDIDWLWRNVVRLNEVSWMLDHKIESQAVFPAAAYIAMAIEAVSQIRNLKDAMMQINAKQPEFEFRNINVSKALVLSNGRAGGLDLELHTLMSPSKLSKVTSSAEWYDFSITSWTAGQATLHCAGSLRVMEKPNKVATPFLEHMKTTGPIFDTWPMDRWYKRLQQEGLNYGPCFQTLSVLQTDASRFRSEAVCTIDTIPSTTPDSSPYYAVHPIIIDGCLQAGILSDSMGIMDRQRAWLPVFIAECRIRPVSVYSQATIRAQSSRKGFSILHSDIRLLDMHDDPLVDLKGVRLTLYASKGGEVPAASGVSRQRQPCLRVSWKPDITALHTSEASQLDEYIRSYSKARNPESSHNKLLEIFGSLIDLAAHKTPRMRVLEIKAEGDSSNEEWRGGIDTMCSLRTIESWESAIISRDGEFYLDENTSNGTFDVVFIPEVSELARHSLKVRC